MKQQYINFKRERPFGDKINATFAFLSQNLKPLIINVLFVAGPFALVAGIGLSIYQNFMVGVVGNTIAQTNDPSQFMFLGFAVIAMGLAMFVAATIVVAIVQRMLRHYVEQGNTDLSPGYFWSNIWGEFFSVLGSSLGISLLLMISMGVVGTPLILLATSMKAPLLFFVIMVVGFAAALLAGSALLLIFPIRNFERKGFFAALSRVFALNEGKWWSTAGLVFVMYIIQATVMGIFMLPMYGVMIVQMLHTQGAADAMQDSGIGVFDIISAFIGSLTMLGYTLAGSIFFIAITFQYFNLRERREASGLLERMQSFGVAQPVHEEEEQY